MRKRVGGQDDVSEVNSWEKLRGVRPGKMMMGNGKDLQQEQKEAVRRAEGLADAIRSRCDFLFMKANVYV